MSKPSWDEAPFWAKWLAQDADGEWWWYEVQPEKGVTRWCSFGMVKAANPPTSYPLWNTTLESRP